MKLRWLSAAALLLGADGNAQTFSMQVGDVDFRKPCTFQFHRRDASYTERGSIHVKRAVVWNTEVGADGQAVEQRVIGELPAPKHGHLAPDVTKPFQPYLNPRNCKAMPDGRAECKDVSLVPRAVTAK